MVSYLLQLLLQLEVVDHCHVAQVDLCEHYLTFADYDLSALVYLHIFSLNIFDIFSLNMCTIFSLNILTILYSILGTHSPPGAQNFSITFVAGPIAIEHKVLVDKVSNFKVFQYLFKYYFLF